MTTSDLPAFLVLGNASTVDEAKALLDLPDGYDGNHPSLLGIAIRDPWENRRIITSPGLGQPVTAWHRDEIYEKRFILWSDTYPTEVRLPDGSIIRGRDGDAVLLANEVVYHRVPLDYQDAVRQDRAEPRHLIRLSGSYVRQIIERYVREQGS